MQIEHKFQLGQIVWVVFRHSDVNFDDHLPIMEMKITSLNARSTIYAEHEGEDKTEINYHLDSIHEHTHASEFESCIYSNKLDAENSAIASLKKSLERFERFNTKIRKMLASKD